MKTKQLVGIIVTGVVVITVGVVGTVSNVVSHKLMAETAVESSSVLQEFFSNQTDSIVLPEREFIGVIKVTGEIGSSDNSYFSTSSYQHQLSLNYIDAMESSALNLGIFLYVDSPGGAVYEADELYQKLMEYKENTNRPIFAYFASQACSGGYYVAMAADKIIANRNAWTGSIGVIISLINCKTLYDKVGIREIDITSGKNKAMGSMGLELTKEQEDILQSLVDEAYDQFVEIVADGRKMDTEKVRTLADGRIYSAKQALENGLIDEIAGFTDAKNSLTAQLGCNPNVLFHEPKTNTAEEFLGSLFGVAENLLPKSEIDFAEDIVENQGNGVLKYYAK